MGTSKREQLGQIVIRPPEGMRDRIKAAADANQRSMNAEIIATLEEKYPAPAPLTADDINGLMLFVMQGADDDEKRSRARHANQILEAAGKILVIGVASDALSERIHGSKVYTAIKSGIKELLEGPGDLTPIEATIQSGRRKQL